MKKLDFFPSRLDFVI